MSKRETKTIYCIARESDSGCFEWFVSNSFRDSAPQCMGDVLFDLDVPVGATHQEVTKAAQEAAINKLYNTSEHCRAVDDLYVGTFSDGSDDGLHSYMVVSRFAYYVATGFIHETIDEAQAEIDRIYAWQRATGRMLAKEYAVSVRIRGSTTTREMDRNLAANHLAEFNENNLPDGVNSVDSARVIYDKNYIEATEKLVYVCVSISVCAMTENDRKARRCQCHLTNGVIDDQSSRV